MPYQPNSDIILDINLSNDLSGTINNPYVVSVENVYKGTLSINNGGTGLNEIPVGSLLIGDTQESLKALTGSSNDLLSWSDESGSWINKSFQIIESLDISSDDNVIFDIEDLSINNSKNYNFSFKEQQPSKFLASPVSSSGQLLARNITQYDLPQSLESMNLFNSHLSGTFAGVAELTSVTGDGSGLSNLSSSQILNFQQDVASIFYLGPHEFEEARINTASLGTVSIDNVLFATGTFYGDGSGLEFIQTYNIDGLKEEIYSYFSGASGIVIDESGTIAAPGLMLEFFSNNSNIEIERTGSDINISLNNNLNISSLTSSIVNTEQIIAEELVLNSLTATTISSSNINSDVFGDLYGTYYGPGSNITDIPNSSLQNSSITINNQIIELGQSVQVSGLSAVISNDENIITENSGTATLLNLNQNLQFQNVTLNYISGNIITGSFFGDGSNIKNINFDSVNSASISSLSSSYITTNDIQSIFGNFSEIFCAKVYGDGSELTNINIENIPGISYYFERSFSGSSNISVSTNDLLITSVELRDDISVNSITASFSGDGSKLTNIQTPLTKKYTGVGFEVGEIVCLDESFSLIKCNNQVKNKSIPIGIISNIIDNEITVQLNGVCSFKNNLTSFNSNDIICVGDNGNGVSYQDVQQNCYAVQVGTILGQNSLYINIKNLWKVK